MVEIRLKDLSAQLQEAKLMRILKKTGDTINKGETVFEAESNKGTMPLKANISGKVNAIKVEAGAKVKAEEVLMVIEESTVSSSSTGSSDGNTSNYFGNLLKPKKQELDCDLCIVGGGPGGYVAAIDAARHGLNVVIVEKYALGGTCLNWGCIPTKAMVRSSEVFKNLREADKYGCHAEGVSVDIKKVVQRKDGVVRQLKEGIQYLMDKHGIKVVKGSAVIKDKETVQIVSPMEETTIKFKDMIIATGSKTSKLPIPGIENEGVIDSTKALDIEKLPSKIIIIGGGVIGMEFAFIFANFGVETYVIEYFDDVLATMDKDISNEISDIALRRGIKLITGARVEKIDKCEDGLCLVSFKKGEDTRFLTAENVLVAVGREPNIEGLELQNAGIELNEKGRGIRVNDRMQTNVPGIYAIGDVTNKIQLAHVASHQGIVAVKNILGLDAVMEYEMVPSAVFTDPEIAAVGVNEKTAVQNDYDIEIGKFPFMANGKALTAGESHGFVKIIKDKKSGIILGGSIIGPHATDLIAEIAIAVKNRLKAEQVAETIHAHPTTAEAVHEAVLCTEGGAIHFAE